MKKIVVTLLLGFVTHTCLFAQSTIGKSREELTKITNTNTNIKLLKGVDTDTLNFLGGIQSIYYYKKDICCSSKSTLPSKFEAPMVDNLKTDNYKKLNNNTWVSPAGNIKVVFKEDKTKGIFTILTTPVINK